MTDRARQNEQRHFIRHEVRAQGRIEPLDETKRDRKPIDIQLWDVGLNGVRVRCPIRLPIGSTWRLHIVREGHLLSSMPVAVRFVSETGAGDYYIGALFMIEPAVLALLGVPARLIRVDRIEAAGAEPTGEFEAPEELGAG